jgi:putative membrane protein
MKKLHPNAVWLFFAKAIVSMLLLLVILNVYLLSLYGQRVSGEVQIYAFFSIIELWLILFAPMLLIVSYIWARLAYNNYFYSLDARGISKQSGIIWKRNVSIPYKNIQNVDIDRGILARMLGLSDVQIQTAGLSGGKYGNRAEGRLPGLSVSDAEKVRDEIMKKI